LLNIIPTLRFHLNKLGCEEDQLTEIGNNVAYSDGQWIFGEKNEEQWDQEQADVQDTEPLEELLCCGKLVVNDLLDGILLVKCNILLLILYH
jgi:hypothetical protein